MVAVRITFSLVSSYLGHIWVYNNSFNATGWSAYIDTEVKVSKRAFILHIKMEFCPIKVSMSAACYVL